MSAALQFSGIGAAIAELALCQVVERQEPEEFESGEAAETTAERVPVLTLAFYRRHTERMLRRYLYASMLVGRAPSILDHPVARGWASSRPVRTFEEAVNFVLDIESCLAQLGALDRCLLSRIVLQEYTVGEVAIMLRISVSTVAAKLSHAIDRLTGILLKAKLLVLPH